MNNLSLPTPIAAYFEADRLDAQAVARCFTTDGVVRDENASHTGATAIAAWKNESSARYTYSSTPHSLRRQGRAYLVTSRVTGNFPGSPADLRYTFVLARGRIASLEIVP